VTINQQIGVKLRGLRESNGYTLQQIGDRIGKSRKAIHAYEIGIVSISVDNLQAILNIYGLRAGAFLDEIKEWD